jgi:DNA-binding Lrp family transcriptional regulator
MRWTTLEARAPHVAARRTRRSAPLVLDEHDLSIIATMENDARRGMGEMAEALGIHRNTVTAKLNRLIRERVIRPAVYVDPRTVGYRAPAIIGIKVAPGEIERTAAQVASLPNIHHVYICVGRYDILLAGSLFRDEDELLAFVTNEVGRTPGVTGVETMITVGLSKVGFAAIDAVPSDRPKNARVREAIAASLDEGDYAIIRELQRSPRQPVFAMASALGMNRNTVAVKLRRLLDEGIVRAVVVADPGMMGYQVTAAIGLSVLSGQIESVSARLKGMRKLQAVVLCIGRYNIMVWCLCRDLEELYETLTETMADIPGIRDVETMLILRTKKATMDYLQPPLRAG